MIGVTLGNYHVLAAIGKGGMGEVFLAEHTLIGRKVAIKVLLRQFSLDVELVSRFFNEARAAAKIQHPGLVEVFDFGHGEDGSAYIVMELLVGESLAVRLAREKRLAPATALAIARQVATALQAAHHQGIIHRDLKPENIYLIADPNAPAEVRTKVLDFGIAKLAHDEAPRSVKTKTGAVFGTPRYMSPEQCKNAGNVDARADIYALGCILFEMLIGRAPFDHDSWGELMAAHIFVPPPRPRDLDPEIPTAIDDVVKRTLEKNPDDRFASMAELADAIEHIWRAVDSSERATLFTPPRGLPAVVPRVLTGAPTQRSGGIAPTLPVTGELTRPEAPSRRTRWLVLGAVGLVGVAVAAVIMVGLFDDDRETASETPVATLAPSEPVTDAPPAVAVAVAPASDLAAPTSPTTVELVVDSVPSGADVYRRSDGVKIGKTPFTRTFERTAGGEVELIIKHSGFHDKRIALSTAHDDKQVAKLVPHGDKPKRKSNTGSDGPTFLDPYGEHK